MGVTLSILIPVVILAYAIWLVIRVCGGRTWQKWKPLSRRCTCGLNSRGGCPLAESCELARSLQNKDEDEGT